VTSLSGAIARLFAWRRKPRTIGLVDQLPLFGGTVVHVVDIDGRRLVFAASANAIRLLARYESPLHDACPEGAASARV